MSKKHHGCAGGHAKDFVAPAGTVAMALDVEGAAPSTCVIPADKMVDLLDALTEQAKQVSYHALVRSAAAEFLKAKRRHDDSAVTGIGMIGLWTAMHHPKAGESMRAEVSEQLRRHGKAHITWCYSAAKGLAIGLAGRFVALAKVASLEPEDSVTVYAAPSDEREWWQ